MPDTAHLRELAKLLKKFLDAVPPLGDRPAFPGITAPNSGAVITASQIGTTALSVTVSTNRPGLNHIVDLLDADSFASVDTVTKANPTGDPFTVTITIPQLADAGPKTFMLQCRVPDSVAGNDHRILFDAYDPMPHVNTLSAKDGDGDDLPGGDHDHTDSGLTAVTVTAAATGLIPLTYHWQVLRVSAETGVTTTSSSTVTPTDSIDLDLIDGATVFPVVIAITVYVSDDASHNSAPETLSFTIT